MRMLRNGSLRTVLSGRRPWIAASLVGLVAVLAVPLPTLVVVPVSDSGSHTSSHATAFGYASSALSWTNLPLARAISPPLRTGAAIGYDPIDGYVLLFGGLNPHVGAMGDTWKFVDGGWTNLTTSLPTAPNARTGATMAYDSSDGYLLLFGGIGPGGTYADTWTFAHNAWSKLSLSGASPPARSYAQMSVGPSTAPIVLFGGISSTGVTLGDTWSFDHGAWTQISTTSTPAPAARAGGAFAYDPTDGIALLFGGQTVTGAYPSDTWAYSANGWENLTAGIQIAPPGRGNTTLAYDPGRGQLLMFGGWNDGALGDTWEFSGGSWQSLTANLTTSPGARYGAVSTYDTADGYLVLFGGMLGASKFGTWVLLSPLTATIGSPTSYVAPGVPTEFVAQVLGGAGPYNDTWQFGDGSPAAVGATVTHDFAAAGDYNVTLTVSDAAGDVLTTFESVGVRLAPPISVSVTASNGHPAVGETVTFTATPSGGAPPYVFSWSSPSGVCPAASGATIDCKSATTGSIGVAVTVTDAAGHSASSGLTVPVGTVAAPSATTSASPTLATSLGSRAFLIPIAGILVGAMCVAILTYIAGRRKAKQQLAMRPHCYAVPAWSETPAEFSADGDPLSSKR